MVSEPLPIRLSFGQLSPEWATLLFIYEYIPRSICTILSRGFDAAAISR